LLFISNIFKIEYLENRAFTIITRRIRFSRK